MRPLLAAPLPVVLAFVSSLAAHPDPAGAEPMLRPRPVGQAALGALSDLVSRLEADPATDWRRVDLEAVRQYLRDLDRVTLEAELAVRDRLGGIELEVRAADPGTVQAIRRLLPDAAARLAAARRWRVAVEPRADGLAVAITSLDPRDVARIRGLGLVGLLVAAATDEAYLLNLARGGPPPAGAAR